MSPIRVSRCLFALSLGLVVSLSFAQGAFAQRRGNSGRYRQMYNSMMQQRNKVLQQQYQEAQKLAEQQRQAQAAEAAKKLEARKTAAEAARQKKEEAHEKAKERRTKEQATKPASVTKPAKTTDAAKASSKDPETPNSTKSTDKPAIDGKTVESKTPSK